MKNRFNIQSMVGKGLVEIRPGVWARTPPEPMVVKKKEGHASPVGTKYWIGIDSGTNTGIAVWDGVEKKFLTIECIQIHRAMDWVKQYNDRDETFVRVEDARLRKWIPQGSGREVLQGVGSVKRDAKIWEDFLKDINCPYEMVAPKDNKTKLNADMFKKMTGWEKPTNEHSRDASMLVFMK